MLSNLSQAIYRWEYLWRKQNVFYWAFGCAGVSLFVYIFFGGSPQSAERPFWYRILTAYFLQNIPTIGAGLLCIRNGLSRRMPSGSRVWLLFGIALCSYSLGNLFFSSWELVWHLSSTGSLGDPFFILFYICLLSAMSIAILTKHVWLKLYQWGIILGIGIYASILLTGILNPPTATLQSETTESTATDRVERVQNSSSSTATTPITAPAIAEPEPQSNAPELVMFFDRLLKPYGQNLNIFYVWCDVVLLMMASAMILAFWGGKVSHTWLFVALATVCYYIADMWYAYAGNQIEEYQTGFMLEVFWILGAIMFGVAAGTEFEQKLAQLDRYYDEEADMFDF